MCPDFVKVFFKDFFFTFHMIQAEFKVNWFVYVQQNSSSRGRRTVEVNHARSGPRRYEIFRSEKSHSS